jgi:L-malate glycosyltransferase
MIESLQTGGSERQFVALTRALEKNRFQASVGCIRAAGAFLEGLSPVTFPLGGSLYGLQSWKTRLRLNRHLRTERIAIAHAFDFYSNLTLVPSARLARVPVVIGSQRQLGDLLSPIQSRAQTAIFRCCDAVVCNSNAAAKRLIGDALHKEKITVIWNGIGPEAFAPARPMLPVRSGWLRVGMIARMNSVAKNHRLFLRTAAQLKNTNPQVEFVLAGDGPLRTGLEREAAELGLGDRVRFLGDCRDIQSLLASLDLSVLPSTSESLSNAIIESMAAGIPVVATDVGGNSELLSEDRGILVPPSSEGDLAAAIARLLQQDAIRIQMGNNCRRFAEDNFTLEKMGRNYSELYLRLLEEKLACLSNANRDFQRDS